MTASDGNLTDSQLLSVSVTDVYEARPIRLPSLKVMEGETVYLFRLMKIPV